MRIANLRDAFGLGLVLSGEFLHGGLTVRALLHVLRPPFRMALARPFHSISCFLASLVLSGVSVASYADGTVNTASSISALPMIEYAGAYSNFDTPEAACADIVAHQWDYTSSTTLVYDHVEPYTANHLKCFAKDSSQPTLGAGWYAVVGIMRSCNGIGWVNYEIACTIAFCPVTPLSQPPFSDACSTSLEQGKGKDVNGKCGTLREPDMVEAEKCIAKKINALSTPKITYSGPSATIRTEAYQNHLLEIWTKSQWLDTIMNSVLFPPETKQACTATYATILAEKQSHGIDSPPSPSGNAAPHVEHRAIDVPRNVAKALINQVTIIKTTTTIVKGKKKTTTVIVSDVEDYIHSATVNPPACDSNISWGGRFDPIDRVHFQLPKKQGGTP